MTKAIYFLYFSCLRIDTDRSSELYSSHTQWVVGHCLANFGMALSQTKNYANA